MRTRGPIFLALLSALTGTVLTPSVASADGMTATGAVFDVVFVAVIALIVGAFYGGGAVALWAARRSWKGKPPSSGRRMLALAVIIVSLLSVASTLSLARALLVGSSLDTILFFSPLVLIPVASMLALADGGRRVLRDDEAAARSQPGPQPPRG